MDGSHPCRVDAELSHYLGSHELGRGVHPCPGIHRPPNELRVGQGGRIAQFRKPGNRQVVDRDYPCRPPGRRHHEVRSVHHVDSADEPLDGRNRQAGPGRMERAGGHRTLCGTHSSRHPLVDPLAPTPAHGVGGHVKIFPYRQPPEGSSAEHADPGWTTEQRGRIESDGQRP